ncbi:MAG TPA: hypothetical protein VFA43_02995 [Gemmatimonadaceae bacterium]|nr:hypothetical protein [Gemmatimonadaceae bacterium]
MIRRFRWLAVVGSLVVAASSGSQARDKNPIHFKGVINDFTIPNSGAWEMHGVWSLEIDRDSTHADFTAAITMERSDLYFVRTPTADPNSLATRNPHTHHIALLYGTVTPLPAGGFHVTGPASMTTITGNGAAPPFETVPPTSTLDIDVTGGALVAFSNIALTFGGPATGHFGTNPIAGVVSGWK